MNNKPTTEDIRKVIAELDANIVNREDMAISFLDEFGEPVWAKVCDLTQEDLDNLFGGGLGSFDGGCRFVESEPEEPPKAAPFWANDWRKKHK